MARAAHATTRKSPLAMLSNVWALFNLLMFLIALSIAAHVVDGYFDRKSSILNLVSSPATIALIFFSLLASSVGAATTLFSFLHTAYWSEAARLSNLAVNMITLALNWLAAGFGIRALRKDSLGGSNRYAKEAKVLAAFHIILMLTTLMHVISLTLFHHDRYNTGTTAAAPGAAAGYGAGANNNNNQNAHGGVLPHHHKMAPGGVGNNNGTAAPVAA